MERHEWLNDAKKVPVGQKRRVYHGAEKRPNLEVYNNADSWSCWCYACNDGGKVRKEVLERVVEAPTKFQKYLSSTDCCTLESLSEHHPEKFKRLVLLLHRKCMSTALLAPYKPLYNLTDDRLVLGWYGSYIGRDCTEKHHAKWFKYHNAGVPMEYVYLQGANSQDSREPVILTEDLFSAIKVKHYTGYSTLCCLGTRIHDAIILFLTADRDVPFYPVSTFDGDKAGEKAARTAAQRLSIRGVEYTSVTIPDNYDPKDLSHTELNELFKFLGEHHG